MSKEKVKKPFYKKWWVWVLAVIVLIGVSGGEEEIPTSEPSSVETTEEENTVDEASTVEATTTEEQTEEVTEPAEVEEPAEPALSVAQENAIRKAESYLQFSAFSKSGLIDQLEFEGFSTEEASFAVENIKVDWKEQAADKAQSYLDLSGFSRSGLIEQLEFEGFTTEEATYGVDKVGL
ncbi:Ltp family lipoprotein [Exiguobacterium profundum]|uniref:Ltp family lipoprotein n=1 Tax=Exiguobacterium TaxID=33986 RepID=UPI001BFC5F5D|nr:MULTISPECIES: Ltp family lipoprotein [Exiguobacterium]MCT4798177.1 Ltp family lipoprotein [Exiguobacterium profundum]